MGKFIVGVAIGFIATAAVKCLKDNTVVEKSADGVSFRFKASFKVS